MKKPFPAQSPGLGQHPSALLTSPSTNVAGVRSMGHDPSWSWCGMGGVGKSWGVWVHLNSSAQAPQPRRKDYPCWELSGLRDQPQHLQRSRGNRTVVLSASFCGSGVFRQAYRGNCGGELPGSVPVILPGPAATCGPCPTPAPHVTRGATSPVKQTSTNLFSAKTDFSNKV